MPTNYLKKLIKAHVYICLLLVLFLILPGCGSGGAHNYHRVQSESEESIESEESLESEETEETEESLESEETEETEESLESEETEETEESLESEETEETEESLESEETEETEESLESEETEETEESLDSEETEETEESLESEETEESEESLESEESEESEDESVDVPWANAQVGDLFKYGNYPQGEGGAVQAISWRVLERTSDSVLVIAEQGLDCKRYNDESKSDITWADCTLRTWLNSTFMNTAFTEEEQSKIQTSELENSVGPDTEDCIFLLSTDELYSSFVDEADRVCYATVYAKSNGADTYKDQASWWLREHGVDNLSARFVATDGDIFSVDASYDGISIRPALRLAL